MFRRIRNFFLRQELERLLQQKKEINERRAKLVYKPPLEEMADRLDECEQLHKQKKKIKKRIKVIGIKMGI